MATKDMPTSLAGWCAVAAHDPVSELVGCDGVGPVRLRRTPIENGLRSERLPRARGGAEERGRYTRHAFPAGPRCTELQPRHEAEPIASERFLRESIGISQVVEDPGSAGPHRLSDVERVTGDECAGLPTPQGDGAKIA